MNRNFKKYKTIVFDCDGVILDSNIIKIDAYFRTTKKLGATETQAQALVDYHVKLGGISRYHKFDWYLQEIMQQPATESAIQVYLDEFSLALRKGLSRCRIAEGLPELRQATPNANWMVVSGGDQKEICALFEKRALSNFFEGGIFGSPDNKDEVLAREKSTGNLQMPALFIGDSKYDYEAATRAGLDFVFLTDWTDVINYQAFCKINNLHVYKNIKSLLV